MGMWDEFDLPDNDMPDFWNPEEPEKLVGELADIGTHENDEGETFPQVTVKGEDGYEVVVTGFRKILRDELVKLVKQDGAKIGDRITIDFQGKPKGKRYFVYRAKLANKAPSRDENVAEDESDF